LYLLTEHGKKKAEYTCVLLLAIIPVLLLPSGEHKHYLYAPTGLFMVFCAGAAIEVIKSRGVQKYFAAAMVAGLLFVSTTYVEHAIYEAEHRPIRNDVLLSRAVDAIALEVAALQRTYGYAHPDFFRVYGRQYDGIPLWDSIFLIPLERRLNAPLVSFFSAWSIGNDNYQQSNRTDFIFVACYGGANHYRREDCIKSFHDKFGYPGYHIVQTIFSQYGLEVTLLKQNER
jgi:hypothetical protein